MAVCIYIPFSDQMWPFGEGERQHKTGEIYIDACDIMMAGFEAGVQFGFYAFEI